MLRIEATVSEKRRFLRYEVSKFILGLAVFLISLVCLCFPHERETPALLFQILLLVGIAQFSLSGWRLRQGALRGGRHTRLIVNSRTMAIVPRGKRALFIKRAEIAAAADGGNTFVMADGSRHRLRDTWAPVGSRFENDFLSPLYDSWWPHCVLHRVRRNLAESGPTLVYVFFILQVGIVVVLPVAVLGPSYWPGLLVVTAILLGILLVVLLLAAYRLFAMAKQNTFRFDGPDAQENWDLMVRGDSESRSR